MQVSAINFNNSFKGFDDEDDEIIDRPSRSHSHTLEDAVDRVDFNKLANGIKETGKTDKKTTPLKFGLVTLLLGTASFIGINKGSQKALKAIATKLDLNAPLNKTAKTISEKLAAMKELRPVEVTSTKTFFANTYNRLRSWFARVTENLGKSGLTAEEKAGQNAGALFVRNAARKAASLALATGVSLGVVSEQYKDTDKNNVPDKLEEISSGAKTASSILGIINDAILD